LYHSHFYAAAVRLAKYSVAPRFSLQNTVDPVQALNLQPVDANSPIAAIYKGIINASVSKATWAKYSSGCKAFACFEAYSRSSYDWPLTVATCRHFALWCFYERKLQTSSIKTYLAGLKFAHHIRGLPSDHLTGDSILAILLKGLTHEALTTAKSPTRRVMTFPLLLILGHKIAVSPWKPLSKQVIWAAALTSFFGSTRLGEILASEEKAFSPTSDCTWEDLQLTTSNSFLLRIKQPKSGEKEGEYVDIFPFSGYNCCPVKALQKLKNLQTMEGVFNIKKPVFTFGSGIFLTTAKLNRVLSTLMSDICSSGIDTISCHSFRAGIPTLLSLFPDLATSDMIKGWGRWSSECYVKYTRLQLSQRERIFASIATALRTIQSPVNP
jgi:hypothetical protein